MKFLELKIPPPIVALIVGSIMLGVAKFDPPLALPTSARIIGALAFVAVGIAVAAAGVISFRRAETTLSPIQPASTTTLVSTGIYAVTRNPMYLGWLLLVVGWAVHLASPVALIGPVVFWLYIDRFQIIPEERALAGLFGSAYTAYTAKVRRWL